ncbi:unnamed protein product [Rotaria socialis]|uniref:F-box domain-containing protein n=1 Tax=Rotaria socialis TaxID=392032 RepID=A0A818N6U8_9BILA|nr:unnamed protein product [Rotaria socialis]
MNDIHILDLPDEMLRIIFNKLNATDMLYSLVNVNQRLDRVVLDPLNVKYLDFVTKPFYIRNLSIHAQILHKMRENILPRIKDKVKKLTVDPISMKFILGVVRYSQLYSLPLIDYKPKILLQHLSNDTSLHLVMNQITHMNVEGFLDDNELLVEDELNIFAMILSFSRCLIDLTYRMHYSRKYFRMPSLIISNTCCLSKALTKLTIYVNIFDDCLYLLNGCLEYLSTLIIRINKIDRSSLSIDRTKKLFKLKYFTLTTPRHTRSYNEELVPLLRRMVNLEELTLYLSVVRNNSTYVDGDELYDDVLKYMPRLNKFIFNIHTYVAGYRSINLPSNIDIRNSFIRRGYPSIDAWADEKFILSRNNCHVYSLPYGFDDFLFMTSCFQGSRFDKVRKVSFYDDYSLEHQFFTIISEAFPFLQHLIIYNSSPLINNQNYASKSISFNHLAVLDILDAHIDYVVQFLSDKNTHLPHLADLAVKYEKLVVATNNFTNNTTRRNCTNIKCLRTIEQFVRAENFDSYFPSL